MTVHVLEDLGPGGLVGRALSGAAGVDYALIRTLGQGGMATAYFAQRVAPDGLSPVVVKVLNPSLVMSAAKAALIMVKKEAVALGRLNERVPQTPFVVRLVDVGEAEVESGAKRFGLPWLAIEYVHGGPEGTTLRERVDRSIDATSFAFDRRRAILAIDSISSGLEAIHEVGVTHRDIKPDNILCCGFGVDEVFKIADFGMARPAGLTATFGGVAAGTPGYAAPEQIVDTKRVGPATDIFAMASTVFELLTGDVYFRADTPTESVALSHGPERRSIAECPHLDPEIRLRSSSVREIDESLAAATHVDPARRPQHAAELASRLKRALSVDKPSTLLPQSAKRIHSIFGGGESASTIPAGWTWSTRHRPRGDERVVTDAAWDGDGTCLAATSRGLEFWDGTEWRGARADGLPGDVYFVRRVGAGEWLVGGDQASFASFSRAGLANVVQGSSSNVRFVKASGEPDDMFVAVGEEPGEQPSLYTFVGGRWLAPARLKRAASINALARWDAERWIVVGRAVDGEGFAAIYSPLSWKVEKIPTPPARAYLSCSGRPERGIALIVGVGGRAVRLDGNKPPYPTVVDEGTVLSVAAVDILGNGWAAGRGSVWMQLAQAPASWRCFWKDESLEAPAVSMFVDVGRVVLMMADGGIVEGRATEG